jgi:putative Flp pilus-assembly TadE/G-like protein
LRAIYGISVTKSEFPRPHDLEAINREFPGWGTTTMLLVRFFRDAHAGVAPVLTLCLGPLLAGAGAAVDYSRANAARATMQAALDSAALALVKQNISEADVSNTAKTYFNANFARPEVQNVEVSGSSSPVSGGSSMSLSASGSVPTTIMRVVGFSTIPITTNARAVALADGLGCVLALNHSAAGAIAGQGSTSVDLKGCSLYDNSASATALAVGGSAKISANSVGVVGGVSNGNNGITVDGGIATGMAPIADPYADVTFPPVSSCTQNNFKPKTSMTINPGVYCGGISVNAGIELNLSAGIYYLDGGDLSVNGGGTLTGTGVTLVFTSKNRGDWATASINGNATVNLTPPISGPTAGISMLGDRAMPVGTSYKFNGGASQYLGGAVYFPKGAIEYAGGAATSTSCTQIIGDTVTFVGNSSVAVNCSSYKTRPFSAWVVKLTS